MRNTKTRFIHYTFPYAHNSAGLRIVHHFCHLMRKAGYDSYITTEGNPDWDTPIYDGTVTDDDLNHRTGRLRALCDESLSILAVVGFPTPRGPANK